MRGMEYLTLTFITNHQDVVTNDLIALIAKHNCRMQESRLSLLGSDISGIMRIVGNWNDISRLEEGLTALKSDTSIGLLLEFKRSDALNTNAQFLPYLVQVIALDTATLVNEISYFFVAQNIQIIDLQTEPFQTTHSKTTMIALSMRINIPAEINIADLRERFMMLCDELNVDGVIEPEKR